MSFIFINIQENCEKDKTAVAAADNKTADKNDEETKENAPEKS